MTISKRREHLLLRMTNDPCGKPQGTTAIIMSKYKYRVEQKKDGSWVEVFCAQNFESAQHWKDGLEANHPSEEYRIINLSR